LVTILVISATAICFPTSTIASIARFKAAIKESIIMKRIISIPIILSLVVLTVLTSYAVEIEPTKLKVSDSQDFCDCFNTYIIDSGVGNDYYKEGVNGEIFTLEQSFFTINEVNSLITIYYENESLCVFRIPGILAIPGYEIIDGYSFSVTESTSINDNITGSCVYFNNKIYNIFDAVNKGLTTTEFLASVLPNTTKLSDIEPTDPSSKTDPSNETTPSTPKEPSIPSNTSISKAIVSGIKDKTYTGKALTQSVTVKVGSTTLKSGTDYTVSYKNNKNVGTATVTIKGKGSYTGSITKTFKITKAKNTMTVTAKTVSAKAKKATTFAKAKAFTISKAHGTVTFTKKLGDRKITVNKKTGKLTVKKGLNKDKTYSVKIAVKAAGNENYKALTKTVTVKVKVK